MTHGGKLKIASNKFSYKYKLFICSHYLKSCCIKVYIWIVQWEAMQARKGTHTFMKILFNVIFIHLKELEECRIRGWFKEGDDVDRFIGLHLWTAVSHGSN